MKRFFLAALIAAPSVVFGQSYGITDLSIGSPFPSDTYAYGISGDGKITGTGTDPNTSELHAFIYHNGSVQDIGDFGFPYGADGDRINNAGQVAGIGYGPGYQAVLYYNGSSHTIGNIDGGYTAPLSMNSKGDIVGRGINGDGNGQGFSYINGHFSALSIDIARGINDSDQYVGSQGYYWSYGGYVHGVEHAVVYSGGAYTDIGNIGGGLRTNTEAYAINNSGQVTGYSTAADGTLHAFLYSNGSMSDIGTMPGYYTYGASINASGQVAGNIETPYGGQIDGFLYSGGQMHALQDLLGSNGADWSGLVVTQMNDNGWIVGYGTINGATHGFLMQPAPEPGTICFIGLGAVLLIRRRTRNAASTARTE